MYYTRNSYTIFYKNNMYKIYYFPISKIFQSYLLKEYINFTKKYIIIKVFLL